ncbi:MAG: hypothetical protein HWN67_09475 [Candidatus Helarchaeota archaeon]|nr:hypothetical protein [Candidatus Helarchaeota archaeon]
MTLTRGRVYPITQTILGIIFIIIGLSVILILPNIIPQDIINSLKRLVAPSLFYPLYTLIGGALILLGVVNLIVGIVFKSKGYYEGEYI